MTVSSDLIISFKDEMFSNDQVVQPSSRRRVRLYLNVSRIMLLII
jgi:hypothetical protein